MKYYDLEFDEQVEELENMIDSINVMLSEIEDDNPFKEEIVDLMNRIWDEKNRIESKTKSNDNEYLLNEYKRSVM